MMAVLPMISQGIFIIRTYAFTGRSKSVGVFLVASWITLFVIYFWILISKYTFGGGLNQLFGDTACIVEESSLAPTGLRFSAIAVFSLATFFFDTLLTVMVFIRCLRFRTMWGPLGKAFVSQGLMAYVMLSAIDLAVAVVYLMPEQAHDGIAILRNPASCIIACRLILKFRRRADPSDMDRDDSQLLRNAIGRVNANVVTQDAKKDHNGPIGHSRPTGHWD
jgi:hypothetical protein